MPDNTIYSVCENYKSDKADVERYIELLKRCREKGITVYTVLPPMDRSIRELVVDKLGIGPDILEFIDSVKDYSQVLNFEYVDDDPFTSTIFTTASIWIWKPACRFLQKCFLRGKRI